ncbi:DUF5988 family protein [Embleya sp. AB8]|uniref:DUF5988 family protein n=1 Tax=Embleya sp. AB8 TaxID=3156304 RepID=UPI003C70A9F6
MSEHPNAMLRGGPATLSGRERIRYVPNRQETLKLFRGNCYHHFERTTQTCLSEGRQLQVFVWHGTTYVAE